MGSSPVYSYRVGDAQGRRWSWRAAGPCTCVARSGGRHTVTSASRAYRLSRALRCQGGSKNAYLRRKDSVQSSYNTGYYVDSLVPRLPTAMFTVKILTHTSRCSCLTALVPSGSANFSTTRANMANARKLTSQGQGASRPADEDYSSRYNVSLNGRDSCSAYLQIAGRYPNPHEETSICTVCLHYT